MRSRGEGLEAVLLVLLAGLVPQAFAQTCAVGASVWHCSCGCCYDYAYCCVSCASYWYAWLLLTLFFLVCLCACLGCGSYGYRRYYIVRRAQPPTAYNVPTSVYSPAGYQPVQPTTYQQQKPYDPSSAQAPPPYNPSQPPPPYQQY